MLCTLREVLANAEKHRYAVGLFNTVNFEMARGVLAAAEETRSPVIIGTAEILLPYGPMEQLASLLVPMAKNASVPVVVHYDHGLTAERVVQAMTLGFSSVMYDCSTVDYDENVRRCRQMAEIAHTFGGSIEAELGHVGANAGGDLSIYTDPDEARNFVAQTGVDALAVAIGTAHGAYADQPKLDIGRLHELYEAVDAPLVLHGGSGLSDEDFRRCIENGIRKINIFTDINNAAARAAAEGYREGLGMTDLIPAITEAVKQETVRKMKLFGCTGQA